MDADGVFQFLPPLTDDEYEGLKADIAARGVMVPVEVDEDGVVIDGHHRLRACRELGIADYPVIVREGLSSEEKIEQALKLNMLRRHLGPAERRKLVLDLRGRGWSSRKIGSVLGVSAATVVRDLHKLEDEGEDLPAEIVGEDGKVRAAKKDVPDDVYEGLGGLPEGMAEAGPMFGARLENASFVGGVDELPEGADVVIATGGDWGEIGRIGMRVLKDGGCLLALCTPGEIPAAIAGLGEELTYFWTGGVTRKEGVQGEKVDNCWQPVLLFGKGDLDIGTWLLDWGEEGQDMGLAVAGFVSSFVLQDGLVVDPCVRGGLSVIAALAVGCRFVGCGDEEGAMEESRMVLGIDSS